MVHGPEHGLHRAVGNRVVDRGGEVGEHHGHHEHDRTDHVRHRAPGGDLADHQGRSAGRRQQAHAVADAVRDLLARALLPLGGRCHVSQSSLLVPRAARIPGFVRRSTQIIPALAACRPSRGARGPSRLPRR